VNIQRTQTITFNGELQEVADSWKGCAFQSEEEWAALVEGNEGERRAAWSCEIGLRELFRGKKLADTHRVPAMI
jgi:hypothetical protein